MSASSSAGQITGAPLDAPADCTIACDKGHLTAHKLILCNHSKYLRDILGKYPNAEHPIIILTELNITDIRVLVNYMYTGELVITNDSSPTNLLRAAQILKIESLTADNHNNSNNNNSSSSNRRNRNNNDHRPIDADTGVDEQSDDEEDNEEDLHNNNNNHIPSMYRLNHHNNNNHNDDGINNQRDQDVDDDDDIDTDHVMNHHDDEDMDDANVQQVVDDQDDDDDYNINNANSRLINSIENIYSLDKFIHTSPPPHHSQQNSSSRGLDKNNKIRCHLCNIGLSDVKCLYRHVLTRHLPEKWGYKCEFCDREFSRDDHLMRHYTTKHKNMEFNREKIRETRRLNREMAKNFHDQISTA